ncbi:guanylin-like isoform X2 [Hyla sarda]|uniref:guanylin-like isoform X2 n=1 Tax=Hyla sarda TaxID=327740 RepID=UPI0024C28996|nr:guanylin-like isoform X2 [Hyla sarda]
MPKCTGLLSCYWLISNLWPVRVGDYTFSLETVKKLREVGDGPKLNDPDVDRDDVPSYEGICSNRALPELRDLCDTQQPALITEILRGLELVADKADECEVCAFAACSGC